MLFRVRSTQYAYLSVLVSLYPRRPAGLRLFLIDSVHQEDDLFEESFDEWDTDDEEEEDRMYSRVSCFTTKDERNLGPRILFSMSTAK